MTDVHPLDNPVRSSLLGPHAHFARRHGQAARYPADVSPFVALPDEPDGDAWRDAALLAGPGALVPLAGLSGRPPQGWQVVMEFAGVQMIDDGMTAEADEEAVRLGPGDVPEILDLVGRTRPGPFLRRTIELGGYLGIRRDGLLVAMAGERLHPHGWTEVSAVCTDEAWRGRGFATRLTRAVAAGIRERGETPFLHAAADNVSAIRLYQSLGFRVRRPMPFLVARVPPEKGSG
jgi:ribosomal protein S18 acetylase RimI-like enzyme